MPGIKHVNIRKVDLNLLVVLDAIYTEGGITRASKKLHLTQPAVTHALNRLRDVFDDPLFVRDGRSMIPTPKARALIGPTRESLRGIEIMLGESDRFDPLTATRRFVVGMRDTMEPTLLPALMERVGRLAPQVDLESVQTDRRALEHELAAGVLDVVLDVLLPTGDHIMQRPVPFDRLIVAARQGHPEVGPGLNLDTYLRQSHVLATVRRRGGGVEDVELNRRGLQRHIRLRCQHHFAAFEVVRNSDLILTMPEGYAKVANAGGALQILDFPLPIPGHDGHLYWHANVDSDPANRWLREQVLAVFGHADPAPDEEAGGGPG